MDLIVFMLCVFINPRDLQCFTIYIYRDVTLQNDYNIRVHVRLGQFRDEIHRTDFHLPGHVCGGAVELSPRGVA